MDYDPEVAADVNALGELAEMGIIDQESPSFGVALKCLEEGYKSLSEKQRYVFDTYIAPKISKECAVCRQGIPISDLPIAYESGVDLCSYHLNRRDSSD